MVDAKDILRKHAREIEEQIDTSDKPVNYSREYALFKDEMAPQYNRYEKWCHSLGSIIKLKFAKKDEDKVQKFLDIAHLEVEPWQTLNLSIMSFIAIFIIGLLSSFAIALIRGGVTIGGIFEAFPLLYFFLMMILAFFIFYFMNGYPKRLANKWRLKASSQMVPAILYTVVYMRHTPNIEKAIAFASKHLQYPLALDFKKVFYDVEIGKFSTMKESLDNYLEGWRDYATEFIESFHLIESSLFEPNDNRRIATLEKALQVVLDGVYDKMLKFTHEVRSPLTNVYMLGVVLPTLALALLPLASAMLQGLIKWYHVFILFNMVVPFFVFYLTDRIMLLRPGGHGETTLLERNPHYYKYKSKKPYIKAALICLPLLVLGFLPLIFGYTPVPEWLGLQADYTFTEMGLGLFGDQMIFGFNQVGDSIKGPFGAGAVLLSLLIPFSIALFFSISFKERTKEMILERGKTRALEKEFNNSLFQLGNRMGDGTPPELVFAKVAESSRGLHTEDFFKKVNYNIQQMGMSVEKALFDPRRGAIIYYPSDLIATSMRVLVESSKKGLKIAAISLMSISEYVKNIHKITARLRDMLAEIVSDMKSNMTFLAPLLSGIVVGLAVMITTILSKLNLAEVGGGDVSGAMNLSTILNIFDMDLMIAPYYLQIAIGIYLIQVIFILTSTLVAVDSGEDKLEKTYKTGSNLMRGIMLYVITAFIGILALFILASVVLGNLV
jgi:hypothetical protein